MTKEEIKASPVGLRFNTGKLPWGQMHYGAMEPMIRVLAYGAEKYDDRNWQKGLVPREVLECLQRHLAALMDGETHDKESGLPHIGHVMANAMFYSYFTEVAPEKAREK
jgi:hypothetical protein